MVLREVGAPAEEHIARLARLAKEKTAAALDVHKEVLFNTGEGGDATSTAPYAQADKSRPLALQWRALCRKSRSALACCAELMTCRVTFAM